MRRTADKIKHYLKKTPEVFINDEAYQLASLKHAPDMASVIWEVKRGFESGVCPEKSPHGSSGTYFLKDAEGRCMAVFKLDKVPYELAAYRLDHHHFAGVPQTVITTLEHPVFGGKRTGACQFFIHDTVTAVELDTRVFAHFSAASVRRIAMLDVRIMNEDRHTSNILVNNHKEIIPIDHGYIFPQDLSTIDLVWISWAQSATPFTESELAYLALIDPEEDRRILLDEIRLPEIFANRLFVATIVLKLSVIRRFSAREIGNLMIRSPLRAHILSPFEYLLEIIKEKNRPNWQSFSRYAYDQIEKFLDTYEKTRQYTYPAANR